MAHLLDVYTGLFSFGLELDVALDAGRVGRPAVWARREALALFDAARVRATAHGSTAGQAESASFAVAAWFDEILARLPGADEAASLQLTLFNSGNAQNEFFHHLAALDPEDEAVREVYWYAMACGFRGHYYFESGDEGSLGKLKTLHGRQLPAPPLDLATLAEERLTPQPYAQPDPLGPRWPLRRELALVRAGGALAVLVPCVFLLVFLLRGATAAAATAPSGTRVSGFVAETKRQGMPASWSVSPPFGMPCRWRTCCSSKLSSAMRHPGDAT